MISNFKEKPDGGYYCSECRMSFGELQATCPYCGSIVANYEDIAVIRGQRAKMTMFEDWGTTIDPEIMEQLITKVKEKQK